MFVRPGRITSRSMDHPVDGIGSNQVPRIDGIAAIKGIAWETVGVDGRIVSIERAQARPSSIQHGLVEIHALFVFGSRAHRSSGSALGDAQGLAVEGPQDAVSGGSLWRRQDPIVRNIIVNPG